MKKIAFTGEKGGTGKSTLVAFFIEYLNHLQIPVNLLDRDPLLTTTEYVRNCQELGRTVLNSHNPTYLVIDTAGSLGSTNLQLKDVTLLIVPFRPHYPDCRAVLSWFEKLSFNLKKKTLFLPNFWQNTKEQREGLQQFKEIVFEQTKLNLVLPPLSNRPALYGCIINGSQQNYFNSNSAANLSTIFQQIIQYEKSQK